MLIQLNLSYLNKSFPACRRQLKIFGMKHQILKSRIRKTQRLDNQINVYLRFKNIVKNARTALVIAAIVVSVSISGSSTRCINFFSKSTISSTMILILLVASPSFSAC